MRPVGCTRPAATASFMRSRTRRLAARGWSAGMLLEPSFMDAVSLLWRCRFPVEPEVLRGRLLGQPAQADAVRPAIGGQRVRRDAAGGLDADPGMLLPERLGPGAADLGRLVVDEDPVGPRRGGRAGVRQGLHLALDRESR